MSGHSSRSGPFIVVKRTPVVKPDQGGHELLYVLVLTLGPSEELLPVKERVVLTTEVALQFEEDRFDIVAGLNVQVFQSAKELSSPGAAWNGGDLGGP